MKDAVVTAKRGAGLNPYLPLLSDYYCCTCSLSNVEESQPASACTSGLLNNEEVNRECYMADKK